MVDSRDLTHVAVSLVALRSLGDVVGRLYGIALRLKVQAKVEMAVELIAGECGRAGVAGLDGIQYLPFGAFPAKSAWISLSGTRRSEVILMNCFSAAFTPSIFETQR